MQYLLPDEIRTDGGTQSRAAIDAAVVDEYGALLRANVLLPSVFVVYDGTDHWLVDGFHRVAAHARLGRSVQAEVAQGTQRDAILLSVAANAAHGLRRTAADKRRAVEVLLRDEEWVGWSDREIGRRCNVDGKFVASVRASICGQPQMTERIVERGGTTYTMAVRKPIEGAPGQPAAPAIDEAEAGQRAVQFVCQACAIKLSRWSGKCPSCNAWNTVAEEAAAPAIAQVAADEGPAPARRDEAADVAALFGRANQALAEAPVANQPQAEPAAARDGDEWYTPAKFIESARKVMGGIDVDPASCEAANAIVGAPVWFDKETNGLGQIWLGRFWLNPPYSETGDWIDYMLEQLEAGHAVEGFVLVNAKVESGWFDKLWDVSPVILLVRGRISFVAGDGGKSQTGYCGQAIAYIGPNRVAFIDEFRQYGRLTAALTEEAAA